jgi:hypothetical protein
MSEPESAGVQKARAQDSREEAPAQQPAPVQSPAEEALTEDRALALLKQADLPAETIEQIARNGAVSRHRKVKLALVEHPHTPRHVSLPLIRQLYTFDLMQVALTPVVPADLKMAADEALCNRLDTVSSGERLSLARRGSGRVAGALLLDPEARVMRVALDNARLTEALIIKALMHPAAPAHYVDAICHHVQWSLRREVRIALLRNEKTPMAKAVEFARGLPPGLLREILQNSRLPQNVKAYLSKDPAQRTPKG